MKPKYNQNFERDFKWYLSMRHIFNFDGVKDYYNKKGVSGKEAFFQWDSNGKILKTKHPNLLKALLKTKGSTNLHIKMYAEDRAACNFSGLEFRALCIKFKAPYWFREAVENQKFKYL